MRFEGPRAALLYTLLGCVFLLGTAQLGHCQIDALSGADATAAGISAVNAFDGLFTPRMELPVPQRKYADWGSDLTVGASLAADTWYSWRSPNRRAAFTCQAIRDGSIILVTELVKRLVHRTRPNGADQFSFWSEHTALSASATGGYGIGFVLPITLGTAAGRIAGADHWASDTVVGGAFGAAVGHFTRGCH
jgi:membrane-associated phospholipid phosphatase